MHMHIYIYIYICICIHLSIMHIIMICIPGASVSGGEDLLPEMRAAALAEEQVQGAILSLYYFMLHDL